MLNESITLTNTEKNNFETYVDFEGNEISLFMTEMNRGKKYSARSKLLFFRDVYDWIQNHISIITPDTPLIDLEYYYDDNSLKMINKLIKTFDTGISQVKIEKITLDELSNAMLKPVFDKMMQHVKNRMEEQEEPSFRMTMRSKLKDILNRRLQQFGCTIISHFMNLDLTKSLMEQEDYLI